MPQTEALARETLGGPGRPNLPIKTTRCFSWNKLVHVFPIVGNLQASGQLGVFGGLSQMLDQYTPNFQDRTGGRVHRTMIGLHDDLGLSIVHLGACQGDDPVGLDRVLGKPT